MPFFHLRLHEYMMMDLHIRGSPNVNVSRRPMNTLNPTLALNIGAPFCKPPSNTDALGHIGYMKFGKVSGITVSGINIQY